MSKRRIEKCRIKFAGKIAVGAQRLNEANALLCSHGGWES